jgi:tetratricopeptide (TPR) repeat protein
LIYWLGFGIYGAAIAAFAAHLAMLAVGWWGVVHVHGLLGRPEWRVFEYDLALIARFAVPAVLALASRERDDPRPYAREIARYAVGKALRALGRSDEAAAMLEECLAWAAEAGVEDSYFHEELAEDYAALGRHADARRQAGRAPELTSDDDEPSRLARLRDLVDGIDVR